MKYVGVKHDRKHGKLYWFSVPESLSEYVYVGCEVLCHTKNGKTKGTVYALLDSNLNAKELDIFNQRNDELKSVYAVAYCASADQIKIPHYVKCSTPSPQKIAKRVQELYDFGEFQTPVIFKPRSDGAMDLKDGYTAFLVSKMLSKPFLYGFCVDF